MTTEIEEVNVLRLNASPFNPRKVLPNIDEITKSIKTTGILEPLLVRRIGNGTRDDRGLEVVDGHRRLQGALNADLQNVPCIIRDMTEEEAREAQLIKALQREGLHPYDEAVHMFNLYQSTRDYGAIAAKIGKPESYVRRRIKLTDLIPSMVKLFVNGEMTLESAFLFARLQKKDQEAGIKEFKGRDIDTNQVKWFISRLYHALKNAPWKLDDAELYPAAGACNVCPKRSGVEPNLFDDVKEKETCTDSNCWSEKMARHIKSLKKATPDLIEIRDDYGSSSSKALSPYDYTPIAKTAEDCSHTKMAVFSDEGENMGKQMKVCTDKNCKIHTNRGRMLATPKSDKEIADRKKELREEKIKTAIRFKIFKEITEAKQLNTPKDVNNFLRQVAYGFWDRVWHDSKRSLFRAWEISADKNKHGVNDFDGPIMERIEKASTADLRRFLLGLCAAPVFVKYSSPDGIADQFGVNVKALRKEAEAEIEAKVKVKKKAKKK